MRRRGDHVILAVHVTERTRQAGRVQTVLTRHGDRIRVRLGLHDVHGEGGSPSGLIVLDVAGTPREAAALRRDLEAIEGVEVRSILFRH